MADSLKAILYERAEGGGRRATLQLLDQRVIPYSHEYMDITNCVDGWKAINSMVVRGAPAIAIALSSNRLSSGPSVIKMVLS